MRLHRKSHNNRIDENNGRICFDTRCLNQPYLGSNGIRQKFSINPIPFSLSNIKFKIIIEE